jgi:hypothetical protein
LIPVNSEACEVIIIGGEIPMRGANPMKFEMNDVECEALREVLESYLSELRVEIAHTDVREFRDALKDKRTLLAGIAERLTTTPA